MRATPLVLSLICTGCSIGPRAYRHPLAAGAAGVGIAIELAALDSSQRPRQVSGELLAVTDTGLWVLADSHPSWVAFAAIFRARFERSGDDDFAGPHPPKKKALDRLRLESRFPQGITPELMRKLVATYGDTAPRLINFLDATRAATARYHDVSQALADGFRPLGPATPAMGQHWVHIGRLIEGKVDPAAPAILEYVTVEGEPAPVLVGVAYAVPLAGDEAPPNTPVPGAWWHTHQGTLDAEGLNGSHAGMGMASGDRVAVLHAWVWLPNPAGDYEAENWLLPLATWVQGF